MKNGKGFFVAAVAVVALCAEAATWADPETGITWTFTVSNGKASIGSGTSSSTAIPKTTSGAITIPSTFGGYPVASIGNYAFSACSSLTAVTIPYGVTSIGSAAFSGCSSLTIVTIPDSVTSIGENAFGLCRSVMEFVVSPDNNDFVSKDGLLLTKDCKTLVRSVNRAVTIPDGVAIIRGGAFSGCSSLTSITIPDSVTSIGSSAFSSCSSLTSVTIPDSVTSIGPSAFSSCSSLTSVTIPDSVTSIGPSAFSSCSSLTSITIPDSVTSIGQHTFNNCSSLTSITIGDSVTSIGPHAFNNCSSLTSVTIGKSVTSIGDMAFLGCNLLKYVEFKGVPLSGLVNSRNLTSGSYIYFPREYGAEWQKLLSSQFKLGGFYQPNKPVVEYVSVKVRENDPTILDCVYRIKSEKPTVKVRALVFEDGVRSFAKVVRPETFIEGTEANIGDAISVNEEHRLSWKVSEDWTNTLAKVKFEVLATEEQLLPLELSTIPKTSSRPAMQVSWNVPKTDDVFNALLWLYADGDEGMTLKNGVLKNGTTQLASGAGLSPMPAVSYVFSKMGFSTLSGDELLYAKRRLRMNSASASAPSGIRQYAYRNLSDE